MMTMWEAMEARISCRAYQEKPVEETICQAIRVMVDDMNSQSGLHIRLIAPDTEHQSELGLSAAMFSGKVSTYLAMIGPDMAEAAEKVGYFGEKLVLYAAQLGLGTCWVAGTYDRSTVSCQVGSDEKLYAVIPLGYAAEKMPAKQKMIRATIRARDRKLEQFVESGIKWAELPEWLRRGVEAVKLGPSAVNQQPVNFVYEQGNVKARLWKKASTMALMDLGIAKCHFEEGARAAGVEGSWDMGDQAQFVISTL